jgi:lysozyme family protein
VIRIEQAIADLIGREGRYSNNANDAGGETMWGITVAVARKHGYDGPMKSMPRGEAEAIYRSEYLIGPGFDKVLQLSPSIADELFDTGVNMGVSVPAKFLQECLTVLNKSHKDGQLYADLVADGQLGAKSLSALGVYLNARGAEGELVLLRMLNALQGARYIAITQTRERNEEFVYGWFLNRVVI